MQNKDVTQRGTGVPEGFTTVTPYIVTSNIERLIDFAKVAFGAVETERSVGGAGGTHCELRIGDSMLMCGGGAPAEGPDKLNRLHIYVPDVDAVWDRALAAGAESVYEPEDKPYGERNGGVKDPAGNHWYIATRRPDSPLLPGMRTITPFLIHPDALGLIEFLKQAFSAREEGVHKTLDGRLLHALLWIGDAAVEFGEAPPIPAAFYLYVADADEVYTQAVAAGARPLYPPRDQPYGNCEGGVADAWGNTWYIASPMTR